MPKGATHNERIHKSLNLWKGFRMHISLYLYLDRLNLTHPDDKQQNTDAQHEPPSLVPDRLVIPLGSKGPAVVGD